MSFIVELKSSEMNILIYLILILPSFIVYLVISGFTSNININNNYYAYAQTTTTTTNNITDLLFEKYYPIVKVDYESDSHGYS